MNILLTDDYIALIKMQRPYIQGDSHEETFNNYMNDIEQDYQDIKNFLDQTQHLVDIGAGMGGIDFLIKQHHPQINVSLLDGEQVETGEHYGYTPDLKFYSNNTVAREFFLANSVAADFYAARDDLVIPCDTLISLNSWGFHYPINRYIKFVQFNRPRTIILDIRPGRQDLADLTDLGYVYHDTLRTWGTKKARTVLFDPLAHVSPLPS